MGLKGFVEGGIASIVAGSVTHPLDLIKVRVQLQGECPIPNPAAAIQPCTRPTVAFPLTVGARIARSEGFFALYSGVSATILRQSLYSTTSMGLYEIFKQKWSTVDRETGSSSMPLGYKIAAGLVSGGVGAAVGSPADVAMVRMQADGRLPMEQRRNYKSVVDALTKMSKQEGMGSLWTGSGLTVNRAMIVMASQLATYDQVKEMIVEKGVMRDGLKTHVMASFVAGFVAAVVSNPIDVVKTRLMNMKVDEAGGEAPYKGAMDCAIKTVRAEGPQAFYKGILPTISRQGPFTTVLFVTLEQVRNLLQDFDF